MRSASQMCGFVGGSEAFSSRAGSGSSPLGSAVIYLLLMLLGMDMLCQITEFLVRRPMQDGVGQESRFSHCVLSVCESLSELREYSEGLTEPGETEDRDHCSSQPGQSVISLLSSEELRKLIEEVRVLDEATLKVGFLCAHLQQRQLPVDCWGHLSWA